MRCRSSLPIERVYTLQVACPTCGTALSWVRSLSDDVIDRIEHSEQARFKPSSQHAPRAMCMASRAGLTSSLLERISLVMMIIMLATGATRRGLGKQQRVAVAAGTRLSDRRPSPWWLCSCSRSHSCSADRRQLGGCVLRCCCRAAWLRRDLLSCRGAVRSHRRPGGLGRRQSAAERRVSQLGGDPRQLAAHDSHASQC